MSLLEDIVIDTSFDGAENNVTLPYGQNETSNEKDPNMLDLRNRSLARPDTAEFSTQILPINETQSLSTSNPNIDKDQSKEDVPSPSPQNPEAKTTTRSTISTDKDNDQSKEVVPTQTQEQNSKKSTKENKKNNKKNDKPKELTIEEKFKILHKENEKLKKRLREVEEEDEKVKIELALEKRKAMKFEAINEQLLNDLEVFKRINRTENGPNNSVVKVTDALLDREDHGTNDESLGKKNLEKGKQSNSATTTYANVVKKNLKEPKNLPSAACKMIPWCKGENCRFRHDASDGDAEVTNKSHPTPRNFRAPINKTQRCYYGAQCYRYNCQFVHPGEKKGITHCRYQERCWFGPDKCRYRHVYKSLSVSSERVNNETSRNAALKEIMEILKKFGIHNNPIDHQSIEKENNAHFLENRPQ